MKIGLTSYRSDSGWKHSLPTAPAGAATWVLAFGGRALVADARPFDDLAAAYPGAAFSGCSTAGEISGVEIDDASLSVAVVSFEHTRTVMTQCVVQGPDDSGHAGAQLAAGLPPEGLRAVFVLSDGLKVNGSALVAGLARGLPKGVPISGGLAGDGSRFEQTWTLVGGRPQAGHACAVGLYGERLLTGNSCDGGWHEFGPQRRITRSVGNVLYELDGQPALELYKTYLGDLAAGLPGSALLFPLSIRRPGTQGKPLVRTILGINEAERSMTFAGDVPVGSEARLMRSTDEGLIGSAATAVAQARQGLPALAQSLVVSVSCVGRRLMLGERTEEEVEVVFDGAPEGCSHIGFYSYGEIAPSQQGVCSDLHNQTMAVTVYGEA